MRVAAVSNTNKYVLDFYSPRRGILQMENAFATRPYISWDDFRGRVYMRPYVFFLQDLTFNSNRWYAREVWQIVITQ